MDEQLKRRLIGATVLVALAIIFLPMLLSHKPVARHTGKMAAIPVEPKRDFDPALLQDALPDKKTPQSSSAPPVATPAKAPAQPATAKPSVAPEKTKAKPKPKPPVVTEKKAAPKPPKKADKKVEKKPAAPKSAPAPTPSAWVVQVASFSSRGSADKLVKKLRKAGLDTMNPAAVTVNGKKYYRVQVGPELDKQRAQKLLPRINRISGTKGQVVRYP
ncbi:SPOR domain-containing protein [Thiolapillus sp.]